MNAWGRQGFPLSTHLGNADRSLRVETRLRLSGLSADCVCAIKLALSHFVWVTQADRAPNRGHQGFRSGPQAGPSVAAGRVGGAGNSRGARGWEFSAPSIRLLGASLAGVWGRARPGSGPDLPTQGDEDPQKEFSGEQQEGRNHLMVWFRGCPQQRRYGRWDVEDPLMIVSTPSPHQSPIHSLPQRLRHRRRTIPFPTRPRRLQRGSYVQPLHLQRRRDLLGHQVEVRLLAGARVVRHMDGHRARLPQPVDAPVGLAVGGGVGQLVPDGMVEGRQVVQARLHGDGVDQEDGDFRFQDFALDPALALVRGDLRGVEPDGAGVQLIGDEAAEAPGEVGATRVAQE